MPEILYVLPLTSSFGNNTLNEITTSVATYIEREKKIRFVPLCSGSAVRRAAQEPFLKFNRKCKLATFNGIDFQGSLKEEQHNGLNQTHRNRRMYRKCGEPGSFLKS